MGLHIGSWPGFGDHHNKFLELFLGGLRDTGCEITSIDTVEDIPASGLDVLFLHWAEKLFWEARDRWDILARIRMLILRLKHLRPETKVVWLVHNLHPHDARPFQTLIWPLYIKSLAQNIDAALTLSPGTVPVVQKRIQALKKKPTSWVWHPAYPQLCTAAPCVATARISRGWKTEHQVFGYCGQVRPYKGVEDLVDAFLQNKDPNWRLLIAGRTLSSKFEHSLRRKAASDSRIRIEIGDLSDLEYEMAVLCCDTIVAPFRSYLHSGSLLHTLSIGRQVLTPRTPFSEALAEQVGGNWATLYDGALTSRTLQDARRNQVRTDAPDLESFAPKQVGEQVLSFLKSL